MMQKRLGRQTLHTAAFRAKGHQRHRHANRQPRLAISLGVAHQHRACNNAPNAFHRRDIGRGVGFARGQRIGPDQRPEQIADAQLAGQGFGQTRRLVGADRDGKAACAQHLDRVNGTGIKGGMNADRLGIGAQQHRVKGIDLGLGPLPRRLTAQPRKPKPQHGPPAMKGGQLILGPQQIAMTHLAKTGIGRFQKVGAGICQSAVQVKNNGAWWRLRHIVTLREAATPCGLTLWG